MKNILKTAALTGGILLLLKGIDDSLEITHYEIVSKKLPPDFDGFKIVQISDIHSDIAPGLFDAIKGEDPDIIVSTGDLVHHGGDYKSVVAFCGRLAGIAPVYAVTGNHDIWRGDYMDMERELSDAGVYTLHSDNVDLRRGDSQIALYGIDDPLSVTTHHIKDFLDRESPKLKPFDGYRILLFHRANWLDYFKDFGFDLILSGHMHGGQVRIPGVGGFIAPRSSWSDKKSMLFPRYVGGLYEFEKTKMIVSRGLGNPMVVPRVFNRRELVSITLRHGKM